MNIIRKLKFFFCDSDLVSQKQWDIENMDKWLDNFSSAFEKLDML